MSNYFTADLHLGNNVIIKRENRPYKDIDEFYESFVKEVNSKCDKEDILNVVGDWITWYDNHHPDIDKVFGLVKRLKCKVRLYTGNNEERLIKERFDGRLDKFRQYCKEKGFETVREDDYISFAEKFFYINHYPKKNKYGYINIFGHVHRSCGIFKTFGINVGIDCNWGQIYSEQDIIDLWEQGNRWYKTDIDYLTR